MKCLICGAEFDPEDGFSLDADICGDCLETMDELTNGKEDA